MSSPDPGVPPGAMACPRCGSPVLPEQDWCLVCGAAARTRLAPTPDWRTPLAVLAIIAVLSLAVIVGAFVLLTGDPASPTGATGASGPTAVAPAAPAPAPAPAPGPTGPTGVPAPDPGATAPPSKPARPKGATGTTGP